jgi:hypothetical protein
MESNNKDCGCSGSIRKTAIFGVLPADTSISSNPNGSITAVLTSNWSYIGFDQNFNYVEADEVGGGTSLTITCDCNNGGCSPTYVDWGIPFDGRVKGYGCDMSGCTGSCTGSTSALVGGVNTPFSSGGFIDLSITPAFMNQGDYLPGAFEAMFYSTAVMSIINSFLNGIYQGQPIPSAIASSVSSFTAPDGYVFAFVNICGRATALIVPNTAVAAENMAGIDGDCNCKKGSGGCNKDSGNGRISCKANGCQSCSLTIKNSIDDDDDFIPMTNFVAQSFIY